MEEIRSHRINLSSVTTTERVRQMTTENEQPLGTPENPFVLAPAEWHTEGLPYGAFCKCKECGRVARSTTIFDFYAKKPGRPLTCETCKTGTSYESVSPLIEKLERDGAFEDDSPA